MEGRTNKLHCVSVLSFFLFILFYGINAFLSMADRNLNTKGSSGFQRPMVPSIWDIITNTQACMQKSQGNTRRNVVRKNNDAGACAFAGEAFQSEDFLGNVGVVASARGRGGERKGRERGVGEGRGGCGEEIPHPEEVNAAMILI